MFHTHTGFYYEIGWFGGSHDGIPDITHAFLSGDRDFIGLDFKNFNSISDTEKLSALHFKVFNDGVELSSSIFSQFISGNNDDSLTGLISVC